MSTQNVNDSNPLSLSGIMAIGTEGLKTGKYIKLSENKLVLGDKKGKLTLLDIGTRMSKIAPQIFNNFSLVELTNVKKGMEALRDKLADIQKNNPIATIFRNLFTGGRYGISTTVYQDTIKILEKEIEKSENTLIVKNKKEKIIKITQTKLDVKTSTKKLEKTAPPSITDNKKELSTQESKKSKLINTTNEISIEKLKDSTNTTTSIKTNSISEKRSIKQIKKENELNKTERITKPKKEIPQTKKESIDSFIERIGNAVRDGLVSNDKEINEKFGVSEFIKFISKEDINEFKTNLLIAIFIGKIENEARKDLFLDDIENIKKKFKVSDFINAKSITGNKKDEFDTKLQVAINKAFIQRELKQKGKLVSGDTDESLLIKYLVGKNEGNKDQIYIEIKDEIEKLDSKIFKAPLSQLKEQVKQIALRARLLHAGIKDELQIKKFQQALPILKDLHEKLDTFAEGKKLTPIEGLGKDSPNFRFLEREYNQFKEEKIKDYLKHNLTKAKLNEDQVVLHAFNNNDCTIEKFKEILNTLNSRIEGKINTQGSDINKAISPSNDKFHQEIGERVQFLNKWGNNFTNEMVQGLDNPNEALHEGICFGLCQDLQMNTLENPTISLKELSDKQLSEMKELSSNEIKDEIEKAKKENRGISEQMIRHSKPRFLQGIHMASKEGYLPGKVGLLHQFRVKEENNFFVLDFSNEEARIRSNAQNSTVSVNKKVETEFNNIKNVLKNVHNATDIRKAEKKQLLSDLNKHIDEGVEKGLWKESNGWMRIGLEGEKHTIALRIDKDRNKVWLFDPNLGYLSFNEKNFNNNKNKCLECLNELLKVHYPNMFGAGVYALKKLPKQK